MRFGRRRAAARLGGVLLVAALLAGCGSDDSPSPDAPESVSAGPAVPGVEVGGPVGQPVVVIDLPLPVTDGTSAVVETGTGRELIDGGHALLSVVAWDGTTGRSSSGEEVMAPRLVTVSEAEVGPVLAELLPGVPEGSRLVVTEPVDVEGELTMQVVVVDVLPTLATARTEGESASNGPPPEGLPEVSERADGAPVVAVPGTEPPEESVSRVLVGGGGATVRPGQELVVQYLSVDWATGETISSTWDDGAPGVVDVDELNEGVRLALLDRRVGSRILAVVPPGEGDGERTLVVVVDLLAASGGEDVVR